ALPHGSLVFRPAYSDGERSGRVAAENAEIAALARLRARFSDSKLPQVVIKMLVHQYRPLLRSQRSEETVWMRGTASRPRCDEPVDQVEQPRALRVQIPFVAHAQRIDGRRVPAHRFIVAQHQRFHDRADDLPDQLARRTHLACRELEATGAVR